MKGHNIVYIIIPLALFSIMSLFDNVQAQTNSTSSANQTTSQQQGDEIGVRHHPSVMIIGVRNKSFSAPRHGLVFIFHSHHADNRLISA